MNSTPASLPPAGEGPSPTGLFRMFVGVALAGVGGGLPAHTRRALLDRAWMTEADYAETFTLAQLAPGPNAVNLAAMVGMRLGGPGAAAAAVTGVLLPGLIAMSAASVLALGQPGGLPPLLQSALKGAACAALGVMMTAAIPVVRVGLGVRWGWHSALLTFLAIGIWRLDLFPVLLLVVGLGLLIHRPSSQTGNTHD